MASSDRDIDARLILLSPQDNVAAARVNLRAGDMLSCHSRCFAVERDTPVGHKIAVVPINTGDKVLKYGGAIGSATRDITPGQLVHTHNLKSDYIATHRDSH